MNFWNTYQWASEFLLKTWATQSFLCLVHLLLSFGDVFSLGQKILLASWGSERDLLEDRIGSLCLTEGRTWLSVVAKTLSGKGKGVLSMLLEPCSTPSHMAPFLHNLKQYLLQAEATLSTSAIQWADCAGSDWFRDLSCGWGCPGYCRQCQNMGSELSCPIPAYFLLYFILTLIGL